MRIEVYNNDVAKAYRILQKKLNNEGIPKKLKEKEYYISKGEQKRLAKKRGLETSSKIMYYINNKGVYLYESIQRKF